MARFKVGDKARLVYTRWRVSEGWCRGAVVTVIGNDAGVFPHGDPYDYTVVLGDGHRGGVLEDQLEPLTNTKQELGSWEEIKGTTGWIPGRTWHAADTSV